MTDDSAAGAAPADDKAALGTAEGGDDIETKAREQGWRPKDEWTGKPEHWKDAATYVEHGDLKSRLAASEKTNAELQEKFSKLGAETTKAIAAIRRNAEKEIDALKSQKAAAVKAGNVEAVEKIDDKIDALKAETAEKIETAEDEDKHEVQADWHVENGWYGSDKPMTDYAETISIGYAEKHPKASMRENLAYVDKKMREKFPDYAWGSKPAPRTEARANGHARVDGGSFTPGLTPKSEPEIPEEDLAVGRQLVAAKAFPDLKAWKKSYLGEKANA